VQPPRDRRANAPRCAGDKRNFSAQIVVHEQRRF
jgi:hypothetical protein